MSLTDTMGSLAVATKGQFLTGGSVDIGTSFVKPAGRVGDELRMSAVVVGIGLLESDMHCMDSRRAHLLRCCASASVQGSPSRIPELNSSTPLAS